MACRFHSLPWLNWPNWRIFKPYSVCNLFDSCFINKLKILIKWKDLSSKLNICKKGFSFVCLFFNLKNFRGWAFNMNWFKGSWCLKCSFSFYYLFHFLLLGNIIYYSYIITLIYNLTVRRKNILLQISHRSWPKHLKTFLLVLFGIIVLLFLGKYHYLKTENTYNCFYF